MLLRKIFRPAAAANNRAVATKRPKPKRPAARTNSARPPGPRARAALTRLGRWRAAFLRHLAESANVTAAAAAAGVDRRTAYELAKADEAFAAAWEESLAEAADALEAEARRRAVAGVERPVTHQGQLVMVGREVASGALVSEAVADAANAVTPGRYRLEPLVLREHSDGLMQFLLRGARPEKYRERVDVKAKVDRPGPRTAAEGEAEADALLAELSRRVGADRA